VDFDTPNARNASGRGGRTAAFKFYEIPDNLAVQAAGPAAPRCDRTVSTAASRQMYVSARILEAIATVTTGSGPTAPMADAG
jgi:hypothetical protein